MLIFFEVTDLEEKHVSLRRNLNHTSKCIIDLIYHISIKVVANVGMNKTVGLLPLNLTVIGSQWVLL